MKNKNLFWSVFFSAIALEALSFVGHGFFPVNQAVFLALGIMILALSIFDLRLGLMAVVAELIIGSKGHLFSMDFGDVTISLRILIWTIVIGVWLGQKVHTTLKEKRPHVKLFASRYFKHYIWLAAFVLWGVVNGLLSGNQLTAIINDANAWLFFLLLLPFYDNFTKKQDLRRLAWVAGGALAWLAAKSLLLLYLFSHNFLGANSILYDWLRDNRMAEITKMQSGFYRIFLQSQIYLVFAFLAGAALLAQRLKHRLDFKQHLPWLIAITAALLVSLSRSYWLGLAAGGFALLVLLLIRHKPGKKALAKWLLWPVASAVAAVVIIALIVVFPWPEPESRVSAFGTLRDRTTQTDEPALASRWQLLPELFESINVNPVLGSGFGTEVTFVTSDPRAIDQNQTAEYTTYAFEWGWLDIWLKLGFLGLIVYLFLLARLIWQYIAIKNTPADWVAACLIALLVIDFFSPYLNHPLGIGAVIIASLALDIHNQAQPKADDDFPDIS